MPTQITLTGITPEELEQIVKNAMTEAVSEAIREQEDQILDVSDVAALMKTSEETVRSWIKSGKLSFYRLGPRLIRFRKSQVLEDMGQIKRNKRK